MMRPTPRLRAALALDGGAELHPVAALASAGSPVGHGLAASATLAEVVAELGLAPYAAEPLTVGGPGRGPIPGELRRWTRDPGIFLLDGSGAEVTADGILQALEPGVFAIDARAQTAHVRLREGDGDVVWQLSRDGAALWRVIPPGHLQLEVPELGALTGGELAEPWLGEAFGHLAASDDPLDRAAAAGLLGRLWTPVAPLRQSLLELLGATLPGPEARAWMAAQPTRVRAVLETRAVEDAGRLTLALEELERAVLDEGARARARAWVSQRDRLESVLFALGGADAAPSLALALGTLDARVAAFHGLWGLLEAWSDDLHLLAVAWREPDAWWGRLAGI